MTRGTSSSQVGLFSTQISEQIVRLRALSRGQDGPSEAHQVDLRRAVMATRLLAGSARIMQLDVLQQFLDELLDWLQRMEQSKSPLNTTQALILESVVELEEALMIHLDGAEREAGADLSDFEDQIDDLLTLIRHNAEKIDGEPERPAAPKAPVAAAALEIGPETLDEVADWLDAEIADGATPDELEVLLEQIEPGLSRLKALQISMQARLDVAGSDVDPSARVAGLVPVDDPGADPLFGRAATLLIEHGEAMDFDVQVEAYGDADELAEGMRGRLAEILALLAQDVVANADAAGNTLTRNLLRVAFTLRVEDGRARLEVADDAPRVQHSAMMGDPDHLSVLGGLRRARALLEQLPGLIRVDSADDEASRFALSVPLDADLPRFRLLKLEDATIAVPTALVDESIDAGGLLYETDESGESVTHGGRTVPLADLAFFVHTVVPANAPSREIAILGSVEKRIGLGCEALGDIVETLELGDAPAGWEPVAYGSIQVEGEAVPVLDVKRLLTLRFRVADPMEEAGSLGDPHVDSFVPADLEAPPEEVDFEPAVPSPRRFQRALLVNQSEFRRRDLARTLEGLGLEVEVSGDLTHASKSIEDQGVDLLVTDLRLGQEGGESFHTLREKYPDLTIVLTSSVAQQYAGELATKTGAHRCWLDPYRKSDLDVLLDDLRG